MRILILSLLFTTLNIHAQMPELIADFNTGTENAFETDIFSQNIIENVRFGDGFIFALNSAATGVELGKYENNELTIIKDIYPGSESSTPVGLYAHDGKIYFSADDGDGIGKLWETDGTEEGTKVAAYLGDSEWSTPEGFITSESGHLYFTYGATLMSFKSGVLDTLDYAISFSIEDDGNSNYTTFGSSIAFLDDYDYSDFVRIYGVQGSEITPLATTGQLSFAASFDGLSAVDSGLYFKVNSQTEADGTYFFNTIDSTLSFVEFESEKLDINRLYSLDNDRIIGYDIDTGYYIIKNNIAELIYEKDDVDLVYKEDLPRAVYNGNLLFLAKTSDFFSNSSKIIYSDGTKDGTTEVADINYWNSNIITDGQFAYFADGITNGFQPTIYKMDLETGELINLYNFTLSSDNFHSIYLLGVIDEELYYVSNLNPEAGRELYSISTNRSSSVNKIVSSDLEVRKYQDHFKILHPEILTAEVTVFNLTGQKMEHFNVRTNTIIPKVEQQGLLLYHIKCGTQEKVVKIHGF